MLEEQFSTGIPDFPLLGGVVVFDGGSPRDFKRADGGQIQRLGVEAMAVAAEVEGQDVVHGMILSIRRSAGTRERPFPAVKREGADACLHRPIFC